MAELDSQPKSIQSLYSWYSDGKLFVNRRYQRKLVWTLVEKQKLVESVLKKYPVPAILLAEQDGGTYEIIDGLQRLHTLMSFIETAFPSLDGRYFDVAQYPTANVRAESRAFPVTGGGRIAVRDVSTFLDYTIAASVMRGATEGEIDDVFSRINTYGHRLSDQERRQAGVQDPFSELIRQLACEIRGDPSSDMLGLDKMPVISIDMPMTKHGYGVVADEVFWVKQGVLRSTDLRDSMDEQCLADIAASIIGGSIIDRSKDALDRIYEDDSDENRRITAALDSYGSDRFCREFKYCLDEVIRICEADTPRKLRSLVYDADATNAFPSVFAILMIAVHEALVKGNKRISDYSGVKRALTGLMSRLNTSRASTSVDERRRNVDIVKGLLDRHLVAGAAPEMSGGHSTIDIEALVRRSEIELPHYELKQGLLRLDGTRAVDDGVANKILRTVCAIANNGRERSGSLLIGVTDSEDDAKRVESLDRISPMQIGSRFVVGVKREAVLLDETCEQYFGRWKNIIRNAPLTPTLVSSVLSSLDYHDYFGLGVIVITIPAQREVSYFDGAIYWRKGDETVKAEAPQTILEIGSRFR